MKINVTLIANMSYRKKHCLQKARTELIDLCKRPNLNYEMKPHTRAGEKKFYSTTFITVSRDK